VEVLEDQPKNHHQSLLAITMHINKESINESAD